MTHTGVASNARAELSLWCCCVTYIPIAARFSKMAFAFLNRSPGLCPSMRRLPLLVALLRDAVSLASEVWSMSADVAIFCAARPSSSDSGCGVACGLSNQQLTSVGGASITASGSTQQPADDGITAVLQWSNALKPTECHISQAS